MERNQRILCIGDSNTYGYDPRSYLGDRYPESVRWTGLLGRMGWAVVSCGQNGREIPERPAQFAAFAHIAQNAVDRAGEKPLITGVLNHSIKHSIPP